MNTFDILVLCSDNNTVGNVSSTFKDVIDDILNEKDIDDDQVNYVYMGLDLDTSNNDYNIINENIIDYDFSYNFGENFFDLVIFEFCPTVNYISILSDSLFEHLKYILNSEGNVLDLFKLNSYKTIYDTYTDQRSADLKDPYQNKYIDYYFDDYVDFLRHYDMQIKDIVSTSIPLIDIVVLEFY